MRGHSDICELLLEAKAHVNARTTKGDSALSLSIWKNHTDTALLLLDYNADPCNIDSYGDTILHDLARNGNIRVMLEILDVLQDPTYKPVSAPAKDPALTKCGLCGKPGKLQNCSRCKKIAYCNRVCQIGHWKAHKSTCLPANAKASTPPAKTAKKDVFMEQGGKEVLLKAVSMRNKKDISPLLCAVKDKHKSIARLLLEYKAEITESEEFQSYHDVGMKSLIDTAMKERKTPLFKDMTDSEFLKRLEETGECEVPLSGEHEAPPIIWACEKGCAEVVEAILAKKPELIKAKDKKGWGPLLTAAHFGNVACIHVLLGCNAHKTEGMRALGASIAQMENAAAIVLLNEGEFDAKMLDAAPLVAMAATTDNATVLEELLSHGASVNNKDSDGLTPLHIALEKNIPKTKVVKLLLDHGAKVDEKALEIRNID